MRRREFIDPTDYDDSISVGLSLSRDYVSFTARNGPVSMVVYQTPEEALRFAAEIVKVADRVASTAAADAVDEAVREAIG